MATSGLLLCPLEESLLCFLHTTEAGCKAVFHVLQHKLQGTKRGAGAMAQQCLKFLHKSSAQLPVSNQVVHNCLSSLTLAAGDLIALAFEGTLICVRACVCVCVCVHARVCTYMHTYYPVALPFSWWLSACRAEPEGSKPYQAAVGIL